ncbi:hypothetical protein PanWU01x14_259110 [Parasponia andersonii]|uniref:Uncharacterized protein n=1 Tax=Parasponia andersonii TaxID=3476 RepID=A0A2P5B9H8_PARAD|nr:hypothetical protein PanWU01x14_259110 [Parasponia andersonii]
MIYVDGCSYKIPSMRHESMSQNPRKSLRTQGHTARLGRIAYRSRLHHKTRREALKSEVMPQGSRRSLTTRGSATRLERKPCYLRTSYPIVGIYPDA